MDVLDLRDLDLKHLEALDAVAEEGTFGRAATRLGYTQSAVSQQIAALERLVGAPVFDRPGGPRPVELTPLGHLVLDHARELLARVDVAAVAVDRFLRGEAGRLTVGTFQSVTTTLLPAIVGRMRDESPDVDIRLVESNEKEIFPRALARGELDVAFTVDQGWPDVATEILFDDPYLVVTELDAGRPGSVPHPRPGRHAARRLPAHQLPAGHRGRAPHRGEGRPRLGVPHQRQHRGGRHGAGRDGMPRWCRASRSTPPTAPSRSTRWSRRIPPAEGRHLVAGRPHPLAPGRALRRPGEGARRRPRRSPRGPRERLT